VRSQLNHNRLTVGLPSYVPTRCGEAERPVSVARHLANVLGIAVIPFLQRAAGITRSAIVLCSG